MGSAFYEQGLAVDRQVKQYQREHPGCDYSRALHAVIHAASYGHQQEVNRATAKYQRDHGGTMAKGWRIYEDTAGNITDIVVDGAGRSISQLSNVVTGLPRNDDGTINVQLAL